MSDINWIKYHACSIAGPLNQRPGRRDTRQTLLEHMMSMFAHDTERIQLVEPELNRLFDTGQLVVINEAGHIGLGKVLFEDGKPVSRQAAAAAKAIFKNLCDRRGIKHELDKMDDDVEQELLNTMAVLIDEKMKPKRKTAA